MIVADLPASSAPEEERTPSRALDRTLRAAGLVVALLATVLTAAQLDAVEIVAGRSAVLTPVEQARALGGFRTLVFPDLAALVR